MEGIFFAFADCLFLMATAIHVIGLIHDLCNQEKARRADGYFYLRKGMDFNCLIVLMGHCIPLEHSVYEANPNFLLLYTVVAVSSKIVIAILLHISCHHWCITLFGGFAVAAALLFTKKETLSDWLPASIFLIGLIVICLLKRKPESLILKE